MRAPKLLLLLSLAWAICLLEAPCPCSSPPSLSSMSPHRLPVQLLEIATDGSTNALLSPLSLQFCLSALMLGARGVTAEEIATVIGLGDHLEGSVLSLRNSLACCVNSSANNLPVGVELAHAIWFDRMFPLNSVYRRTVKRLLRVNAARINKRNPRKAADKINSWIMKHTNLKVNNLVSEADLMSDSVMFIASAFYFHGSWLRRFDPAHTALQNFACGRRVLQVPTMRIRQAFPYYWDRRCGCEVVELPFASNLTMMIVLPKPAADHKEVTACMRRDMAAWLSSLSPTWLTLHLPRFSLTSRVDLRDFLPPLGLGRLLKPGMVDLSGIGDEALMYVGRVLQHVTFEVNEEGAEGTSATLLQVGSRSASLTVSVDRPFYFFVRNPSSGTTLFCGFVQDPTAV